MKVILTREVKSLGQRDDIVNVADGYARNYLFPRSLAVPATDANIAELGKRRKAEEARGEKAVGEAKGVAGQLAGAQLTIQGKVGTGTKLYGSITHADIAEALERQTGIKIDKRKIELEEPIKSLGSYDVPIRLHREAVVHVKVEVVGEQVERAKPEKAEAVEAEPEPEKGEAVEAEPQPEKAEEVEAEPEPEKGEEVEAESKPEKAEEVEAESKPEEAEEVETEPEQADEVEPDSKPENADEEETA